MWRRPGCRTREGRAVAAADRARALDCTSFLAAAGPSDPAVAGIALDGEHLPELVTARKRLPAARCCVRRVQSLGLLVADLDLDLVEETRAAIPVLANRRFWSAAAALSPTRPPTAARDSQVGRMTHQWPLAPFSGSKAAGFEIGGTGTGPAPAFSASMPPTSRFIPASRWPRCSAEEAGFDAAMSSDHFLRGASGKAIPVLPGRG